MVNERKTEKLVRDKLEEMGYNDDPDLIIEEQSSDNPRIDKLLKKASKSEKGKGKGYPEFIIHSKSRSEFLIIIECKADVKKHKSPDLNKYAEYAVDGALYYASHLLKEFDVLAIGVSGENARRFKVSNYLYLKKEGVPEEVPGKKILSFDDYHKGYIHNPKKRSQKYYKLLDYSKEINEHLHGKKVKETVRSLLIGGILIALTHGPFEKGYKSHKKAQQLANALVTAIENELTNAGIPKKKVSPAFAFIKTDTALSGDIEFLKDLIAGIDDNVNSFMRTYDYFDALSEFYIEFLKYANNDKGLGIVLTPPHITDLFCKLAEVDEDSIVVDNCCGTGGFLISAMQKMMLDAERDSTKEKEIQSSQLLGVEYQNDIYALAISNMIIHRASATVGNVFQGDCFDHVSKIKEKKPTIGLLNPPYRAKKGVYELEYVLNNLEMLEKGGKCVAIIPISCVLAQSGENLSLKEKLMEEHTLEAVCSMPIDLFHNSKVGVVTVAMVVTAHKPHHGSKKTWFGYWRDDGFVKVKGKGRTDMNNKWSSIKEHWISSFMNRETHARYSVMKKVAAGDEWCAEAYLEADYSEIEDSNFEDELKKYIAHKIVSD